MNNCHVKNTSFFSKYALTQKLHKLAFWMSSAYSTYGIKWYFVDEWTNSTEYHKNIQLSIGMNRKSPRLRFTDHNPVGITYLQLFTLSQSDLPNFHNCFSPKFTFTFSQKRNIFLLWPWTNNNIRTADGCYVYTSNHGECTSSLSTCVCLDDSFQTKWPWHRYLARWFTLTLSKLGQGHRSRTKVTNNKSHYYRTVRTQSLCLTSSEQEV